MLAIFPFILHSEEYGWRPLINNLPCAVGAHDTFGARSGDPEHVKVDVGKRSAKRLREGVLKHATDLERVCICAIQGWRNGEADVVVGLGRGLGRYCCRGSDPSGRRGCRHRWRPLWLLNSGIYCTVTELSGSGRSHSRAAITWWTRSRHFCSRYRVVWLFC